MIGFSVSLCIVDILKGEVAEAEVEQIIDRTGITTKEGWNEVIGLYKRIFWDVNQGEGEAICRRLIAADKIDQPVLRGEKVSVSVGEIWEVVAVPEVPPSWLDDYLKKYW